jgi:hypothetical protein
MYDVETLKCSTSFRLFRGSVNSSEGKEQSTTMRSEHNIGEVVITAEMRGIVRCNKYSY